MRNARLLSATIAESDQIAALSFTARWLYVLSILLAEDDGTIKMSRLRRRFRSMIEPGRGRNKVGFEAAADELTESELLHHYVARDESFLCHPNFTRYQKIRNPRKSEHPPCPHCARKSNATLSTLDSEGGARPRRGASMMSTKMHDHVPTSPRCVDDDALPPCSRNDLRVQKPLNRIGIGIGREENLARAREQTETAVDNVAFADLGESKPEPPHGRVCLLNLALLDAGVGLSRDEHGEVVVTRGAIPEHLRAQWDELRPHFDGIVPRIPEVAR